MTARYRRDDPASSLFAAVAVEESGRAETQRRACLVEVTRCPGQTAAEIARSAGLDRYTPSRRLPELRGCGAVRNGVMRLCAVTGNMSITWDPSPADRWDA